MQMLISKIRTKPKTLEQRNVLKCISHFIKFTSMINSLVSRLCQVHRRPNLN